MYIKIQTSIKSNGNKGSSNALATYLEKEDVMKENEALKNGELPEPRTGFFNHQEEGIFKNEVISSIDYNKKGLGRNDAKFYAITLSPSQSEQKHLLKNIIDRKINTIDELSRNERKQYERLLIDFTRKSMNEYASHFGRKGLKSGNQLVYFGKIEHNRYAKGTDSLVKNGIIKSGEKKKGLQTHIHVIVSHRDKGQNQKISPMAPEKKGANCKLNGEPTTRGFDRNLFNIKAEKIFDQRYAYERQLEEKVEYRIQADKDPHKEQQIKLANNPIKKRELQKSLIEDYDIRNKYIKENKKLSQEIKPIVKKQKDNELSI
jgi:hypothetical protein